MHKRFFSLIFEWEIGDRGRFVDEAFNLGDLINGSMIISGFAMG